jgi:hypothetical protein
VLQTTDHIYPYPVLVSQFQTGIIKGGALILHSQRNLRQRFAFGLGDVKNITGLKIGDFRLRLFLTLFIILIWVIFTRLGRLSI